MLSIVDEIGRKFKLTYRLNSAEKTTTTAPGDSSTCVSLPVFRHNLLVKSERIVSRLNVWKQLYFAVYVHGVKPKTLPHSASQIIGVRSGWRCLLASSISIRNHYCLTLPRNMPIMTPPPPPSAGWGVKLPTFEWMIAFQIESKKKNNCNVFKNDQIKELQTHPHKFLLCTGRSFVISLITLCSWVLSLCALWVFA